MKRCNRMIDIGRRHFLRGGATAAAAAVAAGAIPSTAEATPALARVSYPSKKIGNVRELKVDKPVQITYPDKDLPGVILKLGRRVEGGVGPDGDIVAFSTLCPHKGFPLAYVAADKTLNCPGHYSRFDCEKGGQEIFGHATQNLPQFRLTCRFSGRHQCRRRRRADLWPPQQRALRLEEAAMTYKRNIDRLPIPPKDANVQNVVCHYCIVGCGYKAISWDVDKQGGRAGRHNFFGADLTKQQEAETAAWFSPAMYNIVKQNGRDVHLVIKPDKHCEVNSGLGLDPRRAPGRALLSRR